MKKSPSHLLIDYMDILPYLCPNTTPGYLNSTMALFKVLERLGIKSAGETIDNYNNNVSLGELMKLRKALKDVGFNK